MRPTNDLNRSLASFACDATVIAVVELSKKTWLVGGIVPGINRHPEKRIDPDEHALLRLLCRWRDEAGKAGHTVTRIAVAQPSRVTLVSPAHLTRAAASGGRRASRKPATPASAAAWCNWHGGS